MSRDQGRGRGGGRRRSKSKEFMDAALDAYIRHEALSLWRVFSEARELAPDAAPQALLSRLGQFDRRGEYAALWNGPWQARVLPAAAGDDGTVFGALEAAVASAVHDERAARLERGDRPLEDLPDYNAFIDRALDRLLEEASGEIEEW